MSVKKETIVALLNKNILIKPSIKQLLLFSMDDLTDFQVDNLYYLLVEADHKQEEYIKIVIKKHPDFIEYIKNFINKEVKIDSRKNENIENENNMRILEEELTKVLNI